MAFHLGIGLEFVYILILLVCSSVGGPTFNVGDPDSPRLQDVAENEAPSGIDGMMDIIIENEDIDGEENRIGDHGHLVEGDIYIEVDNDDDDAEGNEHVRKRRNALRDRESLWPGGAVPYVIDGYFNDNHKKHILGAMQRFHEKTCIRFVPRTIERDYILFTQSLGCWSMVGRTGGRQKISLSGTCRGSRGVIMHELMHAIGFRHEHNRPDRDGYITVYWQNIKEGFTTNFKKYSNDQVQTLGTGYDFLSLMHYPLTAFSKVGNSVTISPRYPSYTISDVGNRNDFSHVDVHRINYLYKCGECEDTDKYYCPIWAMMGECQANKHWMTKYCPFSCDRCKIALASGNGLACIDTTSNCKRWAKIGECERNPEYMLSSCRRSCKQCSAVDVETGTTDDLACADDNTLCYDWATLGECESNSKFMLRHCRRSCHVCTGGDGRIVIDTEAPSCQDTSIECALWAAKNMCKERRSWMAERCRRTCLWCSPEIRTIPDDQDPKTPEETRINDDEILPDERASEVEPDIVGGDNDNGLSNNDNDNNNNRADGGGLWVFRASDVMQLDKSSMEEEEQVEDVEVVTEKQEVDEVEVQPEETPPRRTEIHVERELYGGTVNSTGLTKPQGCVDEHEVCSNWAESGDCASNPEWMSIKCPVSCGLCGDTDIEPACVDRHRNCSDWASIGECDAFPEWMHAKCPQSCGLCDEADPGSERGVNDHACFDEHIHCKNMAKLDKCDQDHVWMRMNCKKSCHFCHLPQLDPPCTDTQFRCKELADEGECRTNKGWMGYQCPLSCNTCHKQDKYQKCRDKTRNCPSLARKGQCRSRRVFMSDICPYSCGLCRVGKTQRVVVNRYQSLVQSLAVATSTSAKRRPHQSLQSQLQLSTDDPNDGEVSPTAAANVKRECRDRNPQCPTWAKTTRCQVNIGYMEENCRLSCNWCPPEETCVDEDGGCEKWARGGHCLTNEDGLRSKCQKSCGHCGEVEECRDVHRKCRAWTKEGWCARSPLFMTKFCSPSCGLCDDNRPDGSNHTAIVTEVLSRTKGRPTKAQKQRQQQQQTEGQGVTVNETTVETPVVVGEELTPKQLKALKKAQKKLKQQQQRQKKIEQARRKAAKKNSGKNGLPLREGLDEAAIE